MRVRAMTYIQKHTPELESDGYRSSKLGYEAAQEVGFIRCLAHGYPTPLARWHCHDEYELHLITASSGKCFVGDWIGNFEPGQLVLTGPRLPHNWISSNVPDCGYPERDWVIHFPHAPLESTLKQLPDGRFLSQLLERSRRGIEFFDLSDQALAYWRRMKSSQPLMRYGIFLELLDELAHTENYRLLSAMPLQGGGDESTAQVNLIINRILENSQQDFCIADLAAELDLSENHFSRFFKQATGNTFTEFLTHVRIHRACQLLMETHRQVTLICYDVGFNNISNFNRRFHDVKGMTPTEFRQQMQSRFGQK